MLQIQFLKQLIIYKLFWKGNILLYNLEMSESIRVIVRIRPISTSQRERGCKDIVVVDEENNQINLSKPEEQDNIKSFAYDAVFATTSEQAVVYSKAAYELVEHVIQGYNGTVFAYGQTGCGKTHSMVGQPDNAILQGIIPRCFGHILKSISDMPQKQFLLRCSFLQIYNEEIHDLLGDPKVKLELKQSPEKGVFVKDISMRQASTHQQLMDFLHIGTKNRAVGQTAMNKDSSRSHLLFALHLESASGDGGEKKYMASKLNLVDLAGSERLGKTGATGDRMKQAQKINLSLSALGNVINALVQGKSQHIPYRDSKLTRLLQDSLGGNTKTVMLANCSPADYNYEETLSTLRYASRAKMIKNKPVINEDPKDALLKQYALEIQKLKQQIQNGGVVVVKSEEMPDLHNKLKEKETQLQVQRNQKENLRKRILQLQSKHIEANKVNVDPTVLQSLKRISLLASRHKPITQKVSIQLDDGELQLQDSMLKNVGPSKFKKQDPNIVKALKEKIKQLERQVRDVGHESYQDKQCLLQDIRYLNKQNKFLEKVLGMLLQNHELEEIRESSVYNEEKEEYRVPAFYMKNKELVFPKLQPQQSIDMIKEMHDRRQVMVENEKQNKQPIFKVREMKKRKTRQFDVNDILKEARIEDSGVFSPSEAKKINNKFKLEPIVKL